MAKPREEAMENIPPPMLPSQDFLGEIRSNRRCLLSANLRNRAPVSLNQINTKMESGRIGFGHTARFRGILKASTFSRAKGSATCNWLSME